MSLEPFLTEAVKFEIIRQLDASPVEVCGFVITSGDGYECVPCANVHPEPANNFEMSVADSNRAVTDPTVVAVYHTHPSGQLSPSKADMRSQKAVAKPFVIGVRDPLSGVAGVFSFGDHLLDAPLYGRKWHYGVYDCLEAVRSWYHQMVGIYIPPTPRNDFWWNPDRQDELDEDDKDMYVKAIDLHGFVQFEPNMGDPSHRWHPKPGDIVGMQFDSMYVNHTAVYIGNNLMYHHRQNRPSGDTPIGYLMGTGAIRLWCRHRSFV